MKKYLTITTAIIFAVSAQTLVFAKDSSKIEAAEIAFEQLLSKKDLANLLSDSGAIALEKILLPSENPQKSFKDNYDLYEKIVADPNKSPDFNLSKQELNKIINGYQENIIKLLEDTYAFKIEKRNNPELTLSKYLNKVVNKNITLLSHYYKANQNIALYDINKEQPMSVTIKEHKDWPSSALHQKMLVKVAALRVIEANLKYAKAGLTYDLALFDIISIARTSKTETNIKFNNGVLDFTLPQEVYKYVPFGTKKLVSRDENFMTALQEIQKKKQNPKYDFATKRDASKQGRGQDYDPTKQPSIYDSPMGPGSVR